MEPRQSGIIGGALGVAGAVIIVLGVAIAFSINLMIYPEVPYSNDFLQLLLVGSFSVGAAGVLLLVSIILIGASSIEKYSWQFYSSVIVAIIGVIGSILCMVGMGGIIGAAGGVVALVAGIYVARAVRYLRHEEREPVPT